jgi:hypothetical protein
VFRGVSAQCVCASVKLALRYKRSVAATLSLWPVIPCHGRVSVRPVRRLTGCRTFIGARWRGTSLSQNGTHGLTHHEHSVTNPHAGASPTLTLAAQLTCVPRTCHQAPRTLRGTPKARTTLLPIDHAVCALLVPGSGLEAQQRPPFVRPSGGSHARCTGAATSRPYCPNHPRSPCDHQSCCRQ